MHSVFLPVSFSLFLSLILYCPCFLVSFISICPTFLSFTSHFPLSLSARFDFVSPFSSGFSFFVCLPPFTSLSPFSFMPCFWHDAQNHINTLLPITHTRVQKAERGREGAAKNRLSTVTCPHTEKWAVSSCSLCLFNRSCKILTTCPNTIPLNPKPRFTGSISCLKSVFILSHFCHRPCTITQTLCVQNTHMYRAVQPTFPVWWDTSTTKNVVEESSLTMRSLCFCVSTVEKPTAPRLAETTMCEPNTPRPSTTPWQPPTAAGTTPLTPTTTPAKRG